MAWSTALSTSPITWAKMGTRWRSRPLSLPTYLTHHPAQQPEYIPQISRYSFYLRSDLVSMFLDLMLEIESEPSIVGQTLLLRHEIITNGAMMGLVDR
jgi:hypothetical protein